MKKVNLAIIASIVIVVLTLGILSFLFVQKLKTIPLERPPQVTTPVKEPLPEAKVNLYKNTAIGFDLELPLQWVPVIQNDSADYFDIYFYNQKYQTDMKGSDNPLLTLMEKKVPYIHLNINGSDFVKTPDFNIKDQVTSPAGGPKGSFDVKLLSWNEKITPRGQKFYTYTTEIQADGGIKTMGAIWVVNGRLYTLTSDDTTELSALENMAMSFSLTK